jgi:acyl-CoA reductase-like NAD-dependent aldehyde dehydrogenase
MNEIESKLLASIPTQLLVGARWVDAADGAAFPVHDPATGETLARAASATPEDGMRALRVGRGTEPDVAIGPLIDDRAAPEARMVLARAHRLIESVETGMMGINVGVVSNAAAPFGGVKQSGLGPERGVEGLHEDLETKYTFIPKGDA